MKVYIVVDMEGMAGVMNSVDYCAPASRYYEVGRALATRQTNAAIEGALDAGADEILVVDGHSQGTIDQQMLHQSARLLAGAWLGYPYGCDSSFDVAFILGQHAKAGTDGGHLCHTMGYDVADLTLNGLSIGGVGLNMLVATYYGVPTVLAAGDLAACEEARALVPDIETAVMKEGVRRGAPEDLTAEDAEAFNASAVHLHYEVACRLITEAARRAIERRAEIGRFWIEPPYELIRTDRPSRDGRPGARWRQYADDLIEMLSQPAVHLPRSANLPLL